MAPHEKNEDGTAASSPTATTTTTTTLLFSPSSQNSTVSSNNNNTTGTIVAVDDDDTTTSQRTDDLLHPQHSNQNHPSLQQQQQQQQPLLLKATASMCYHCFDTLIDTLQHSSLSITTTTRKHYNNNMNNNNISNTTHKRTNASTSVPAFVNELLPDGASVECPLFVTWETSSSSSKTTTTKATTTTTNNNDEDSNTTTTTTTTTTIVPPSPSLSSNNNNNNRKWQLRGCVGSLHPRLLSIAVGEYAIISALKDRRFRPITLSEVNSSLRVSVSLLINYELCHHVWDWEIGIHGIVIEFDDNNNMVKRGGGQQPLQKHYDATYLPEVAKQQQWDHRRTITSLIRKAGYTGIIDEKLLSTIRCKRYQSSKCTVTFDEYIVLHKNNGHGQDDSMPLVPPMHKTKYSSWSTSSLPSSCINM